jgi:hypothetical protein
VPNETLGKDKGEPLDMRRGLSHSSARHSEEGPIVRIEHLNARATRQSLFERNLHDRSRMQHRIHPCSYERLVLRQPDGRAGRDKQAHNGAPGIKFPWFVFFQNDSGLRPDDPPWNMRVAMVLFAALCIGIGVLPGPLYAILPYPIDFVPYTASHVVVYLQLLLFSGLAFFLMLGWLRRTLTITLDVDWFYRKLGVLLARSLDRSIETAWIAVVNGAELGARKIVRVVQRHHGPEAVLARTWSTGSMVFWTTIILAAYLVLSYL